MQMWDFFDIAYQVIFGGTKGNRDVIKRSKIHNVVLLL